MLEFKSGITEEDFYRQDAAKNINGAIENIDVLERIYKEGCQEEGVEPSEEMHTLVEQFKEELNGEDLDKAMSTLSDILHIAGDVLDEEDIMSADHAVSEHIYTAGFDLQDAEVYKENAEKNVSEDEENKIDITEIDMDNDMDTDIDEMGSDIEINADDVDDDTDGIDSGWGD